jgi:two-component system, cell cycle sensor histidine kinase and response regulator CckA
MAIEVLRMKFTDEEDKVMLDTIAASAQRGADMVKQVLTFSRGVEGQRIPVPYTHIVREVERIIRQTFPKSIQLRSHLVSDLWSVIGDATQLHQILVNLCVNARDAMPEGGTLTIKASNVVLDEHFVSMNSEAKAGPYVKLSVADSGTGIPPKVRERIFDPFFTTKSLDKGTGLGLSTVLGLIRSHGGFITVYSEVGKGSQFNVYLPAVSGEASQPQSESSILPRGKGEVILVVDDEASIRTMTKQTLETFGYRVLTASHGAQAVALCAQNNGKVDVMLTDLAMPIMDGTATIRAVQSLDPGMDIIAATGLDSNVSIADLEQLGAKGFLHKPFTAECLLRAIRQVLESSAH